MVVKDTRYCSSAGQSSSNFDKFHRARALVGKLDDGDPEILAVAMSEARILKRLKVR